MKKYEIEYRDCTGMRCGVEVEAVHEKEAITIYQQELIESGDYMTELISVDEVENAIHDEPDDWKLEDGTVLDQESQDALNDAFLNYVNGDGMTLKQVWDKEIEDEKNK